MSEFIKFEFNYLKALEAIIWFAQRKPGISHFTLAKVFYYADKEHLTKYSRPILGDTYIAMQHGPVPSGVRDLLRLTSFLDPDMLDAVVNSLDLTREGAVPRVKVKREPELSVFSRTDIECMEYALDKFGGMDFGKLKDLTHQERAYIEAPTNGPMDYSLMIDEGLPGRDEIIEEIRETAAYAVL